jgi:hypothetical protein
VNLASDQLSMEFEMSQFMGNCVALAIRVMQRVDANDRHSILYVNHSRQLLVEWREPHMSAQCFGDFLNGRRRGLNSKAGEKLLCPDVWVIGS